MLLILVHRKQWNRFSSQNDIVGIITDGDPDHTEMSLACVAKEFPENIFYFAKLDTNLSPEESV